MDFYAFSWCLEMFGYFERIDLPKISKEKRYPIETMTTNSSITGSISLLSFKKFLCFRQIIGSMYFVGTSKVC